MVPVVTPVVCAGVMSTWNRTFRENMEVLLDLRYSALNVDVGAETGVHEENHRPAASH